MSESSESSVQRRRFDPEGDLYTSPLEPYNDRVIQFNVLKQMGYPVDLQPIPVNDFPEDFFTRNEMEWERDNFPVWARPVVHDPGFEEFVEDPDIPGDCICSDDEELDRQLDNHPMKLAVQVDMTDVHMLAYDIDCFDRNELRFLNDGGSGLLTRDLLIGCFMAALERYADRKARGYQCSRDTSWAAVTVDDFIRHKIYELQGFRPASPEQLGYLVMNYYKLAEQAQPEILKYKRPQNNL